MMIEHRFRVDIEDNSAFERRGALVYDVNASLRAKIGESFCA